MESASWEILAACIAYLQGIHSSMASLIVHVDVPMPDVLFLRWDGVAQVRQLLRELKAKVPHALDKVPHASLVVSAFEMQLRDVHCPNELIFPPQMYHDFVNLGRALGQSKEDSIAWIQALYARIPQPYRVRMDVVLKFLQMQCDALNIEKTMYIVERYAPLLIRDGKSAFMSLHHTEGLPGLTECLLLFLQHYEHRDGGATPLELNHCVDQLIQDTVFTTLFKSASKATLAAIRIQSSYRGWTCRRWSCLRILYSTGPFPKTFRQQYLNLTKRILQWSLDKLLGEKKRLKHELQAFDKAFYNVNYRPPMPSEKEILRPLYEMYHFLRLLVDYQRQNDKDQTFFLDFLQTATTEQLTTSKEKHQMQLLLFARHFYICCGQMVQKEEDYGHIVQQYMQLCRVNWRKQREYLDMFPL